MIETIFILIPPQTHVRSTKGSKMMFRIPEVCQKLKKKKPCAEYRKTGICKHVLSEGGKKRKRLLEKYYKYQADVRALCTEKGFTLPICGWALYFHVPIPIRWKQWRRDMLHGQLKLSKPDIDNYEKAFFDSMRVQDEKIAQLSGHGKFWFDPAKEDDPAKKDGFIEIRLNTPLYNPYNIEFIDQSLIDQRKPRKYTRKVQEEKPKRNPKPLTISQKHLFDNDKQLQ